MIDDWLEIETLFWQKLKVKWNLSFEIELEIGMHIVWQEWN